MKKGGIGCPLALPAQITAIGFDLSGMMARGLHSFPETTLGGLYDVLMHFSSIL